VKHAVYLLKINTYQTGTVMKKRTELGTSKMGDDEGFKRGKWEEILAVDKNLFIVGWNLLSCCIGSEP
jgi:hypothetical protein